MKTSKTQKLKHTLFLTLVQLFAITAIMAQSPQKISYQAVVRDGSNELVTSSSVGMKISILQGSATGTVVYEEEFVPTTNANGLVSIEIGGTVMFSELDWSNGPFFIESATDPTGGTDYTIVGTSQLLSVPFALYAETSGDATPPLSIVIDIDGNIYTTVTIGTQIWMQQNLKTTRYQNGDVIPNAQNNFTWANLTTGAYSVFDTVGSNDELLGYNDAEYGKLYNWYAVEDNRNVCPTGWHVPTDAEWTVLTDFLGGFSVAGGKMKEVGFVHWQRQNEGATNESGFSGLPGGFRFIDGTVVEGTFGGLGNQGLWWSSTEDDAELAWCQYLLRDAMNSIRFSFEKGLGFSVRCLRD